MYRPGLRCARALPRAAGRRRASQVLGQQPLQRDGARVALRADQAELPVRRPTRACLLCAGTRAGRMRAAAGCARCAAAARVGARRCGRACGDDGVPTTIWYYDSNIITLVLILLIDLCILHYSCFRRIIGISSCAGTPSRVSDSCAVLLSRLPLVLLMIVILLLLCLLY